MKLFFKLRIFCLGFGFFIGLSTLLPAQTPQSFSYQAVARDATGTMLINQNVGFRFGLWRTDPVSGTMVYRETHNVNTDQFGIAHLNVGGGTVVDGIFGDIDWGNGPYFLKVEMDASGGTTYLEMGSTQLLSVPYALHAGTASGITGNFTEGLIPFGSAGGGSLTESSDLSWNGYQLNITPSAQTSNTLIRGGNTTMTGNNNTILGAGSFTSNTSGGSNVSIGFQTLNANTTGNNNTAVGYQSLRGNTEGNNNTALGFWALRNNINGNQNTSIGWNSMFSNTSGSFNTAFGFMSLNKNETGSSNLSLGAYALEHLNNSDNNVAIGRQAGQLFGIGVGSPLTEANNSIFIGQDARPDGNSNTNQIVIGYDGRGLGSNTTRIGNSSTTHSHLDGSVSIGTTDTPGSRLVVTGSGTTLATAALNVRSNTPSSLLYVRDDGNIGMGTTDPKAKLHINGSLSRNAPVTKTGNFTLADTENWIIVNNASANTTVTLPSASIWTGREVMLKNLSDTYTVISNASNVVPIGGTSAGTSILPGKEGSWVTLVSNGSNWVAMKDNGDGEEYYLGQEVHGGIVFYLYKDSNGNQRGFVVSKIESGPLAWQNTGVLVNANRTEDGEYNYNLMSNSPAKVWVENNLNISGETDWYIPSLDEMLLLINNRVHAEAGLRAASATLMRYNYSYWTSTESNGSDALYMTLTSYGTNDKTGSFRVRAIKKF